MTALSIQQSAAAHCLGGARDADEFLTDEQLCELLKVTSRTTMRWRRDGDGPPFVRIGPRNIRYPQRALQAWIASRTFVHRAAEAVAA